MKDPGPLSFLLRSHRATNTRLLSLSLSLVSSLITFLPVCRRVSALSFSPHNSSSLLSPFDALNSNTVISSSVCHTEPPRLCHFSFSLTVLTQNRTSVFGGGQNSGVCEGRGGCFAPASQRRICGKRNTHTNTHPISFLFPPSPLVLLIS